jgi:thiol-disulfide isomerase/thioredoxin
MTTTIKLLAALLALTAGMFARQVGAATLKVGDPAPKLQVSSWAQGEPIKEFERDKAYIVEFWATWCGPCVVSIPLLDDLHNKFKDKGLIVIGQNVWEQKPEAVAPFIKKMGDKMTYRIALDLITGEDKGVMAQTWMVAAGQNGIPAAFLIDKRGLIAWIGHPMNLKEKLLKEVLAGSFDIRKAAAEYEQRQKIEQRMNTLWAEFRRHSRAKEWDRAESTLAQVEKLMSEDERDNLTTTRFGLLLKRGDYTSAYKLAAKFSEAHADDAMTQNALAWQIATDEGIERRDLDLAEKIARRANTATKGENAEILDTLARVLFMKGQKEAAVELQEKAVARADGGRQTQFRKILDNYKAGKMPDDVRINALRHELSENLEKKEWDRAERVLGELETLLPQDQGGELGSKRFRILAGRKDYKGAEELAIRLSEARKDGTMVLNQLAWEVAISRDVPQRELALAERIARRANEGSNGSNAEVLDTLARLLFLKGDTTAAIELQEKAAKFAKGNRQTQFQATLNSYKEGKLPAPY